MIGLNQVDSQIVLNWGSSSLMFKCLSEFFKKLINFKSTIEAHFVTINAILKLCCTNCFIWWILMGELVFIMQTQVELESCVFSLEKKWGFIFVYFFVCVN